MSPRAIAAVHAAVAVTLLGVAAFRWRSNSTTERSRNLMPSLGPELPTTGTASLDSAVADVVDNDPFRIANEPSDVRYRITAIEAAATTPPVVVREPGPSLTLKAIVGGPPWQALIEGVPGQGHAMLVHAGTKFDKVLVREIARDSVIIRTADTTLVLRFARRS